MALDEIIRQDEDNIVNAGPGITAIPKRVSVACDKSISHDTLFFIIFQKYFSRVDVSLQAALSRFILRFKIFRELFLMETSTHLILSFLLQMLESDAVETSL